jgi:hypothetical protein
MAKKPPLRIEFQCHAFKSDIAGQELAAAALHLYRGDDLQCLPVHDRYAALHPVEGKYVGPFTLAREVDRYARALRGVVEFAGAKYVVNHVPDVCTMRDMIVEALMKAADQQ